MALSSDACRFVFNIYPYSGWAQTLENAVTTFVRSAGIRVDVTSRLRTCEQQNALHQAGRTTARATTSQHEFGFAFDLVPRSGFQRYGATFAQAVKWLVALAEFYGGYGLAERDHAHLTVWHNDKWRAFIAARDIAYSVPIPGRRAPGPTTPAPRPTTPPPPPRFSPIPIAPVPRPGPAPIVPGLRPRPAPVIVIPPPPRCPSGLFETPMFPCEPPAPPTVTQPVCPPHVSAATCQALWEAYLRG